ncbi:neurogenic locus notch homolog protein 2-like [Mytilus trossulus]|uniref:neurogenic locus notch homolog protein 2-like n=1 Tax=Mytilus trossulus TaxID=6551 RepID=UPI0030057D17
MTITHTLNSLQVCYKHKYVTESGGVNYDFGCAQLEIIQRRINGFVDFYRGWSAYKEGFGNVNGEYWLGNDNIHEITSHSNHDLRIELEDFDGNMRYAEYTTFSVGDEGSGYRLLLYNYSGNAGDSLVHHNGMKFTTFDRDNDPNTANNCAVLFKGAWCSWWQKNAVEDKTCGVCKNGGVFDATRNRCKCPIGFVGSCCNDFSVCGFHPCQHGGKCTTNGQGYNCTCTPGYAGSNCRIDIDECASNPCQNGGSCRDKVNKYSCSCITGYTGINCQTGKLEYWPYYTIGLICY